MLKASPGLERVRLLESYGRDLLALNLSAYDPLQIFESGRMG